MRRALSPAHWRQSLRAWPRAARCAGSAHVQPATVYGGQQRTFTTAVPASYYETTTLSAEDLRFARRVAAITPSALDAAAVKKSVAMVHRILQQPTAEDTVPMHQLLRVLVGYQGYVVPTAEAVSTLPADQLMLLTYTSESGSPILIACTDEAALGEAGSAADTDGGLRPEDGAFIRMTGTELTTHWQQSIVADKGNNAHISGLVIDPRVDGTALSMNEQLQPVMLGLGGALQAEDALRTVSAYLTEEDGDGRDGTPPTEALQILAQFHFTVLLNDTAEGDCRLQSTADGTAVVMTAVDLASYGQQVLSSAGGAGDWSMAHYPLRDVIRSTLAADGSAASAGVQIVYGWEGGEEELASLTQITLPSAADVLNLFSNAGIDLLAEPPRAA